jgi:hypothetical protein
MLRTGKAAEPRCLTRKDFLFQSTFEAVFTTLRGTPAAGTHQFWVGWSLEAYTATTAPYRQYFSIQANGHRTTVNRHERPVYCIKISSDVNRYTVIASLQSRSVSRCMSCNISHAFSGSHSYPRLIFLVCGRHSMRRSCSRLRARFRNVNIACSSLPRSEKI